MAHTDIKAFLLVLAICFVLEAKPLNPKKVLYAINCGAPSGYKGANGIAYERDVQTDPETIVSDYSLNAEVASQTIKYTRESEIYMTERHAYKTFSYRVPLQKEGTYILILKFAEMYFKEKGKRVFNIKFGSKKVVDGLDIVEKVGRFAAYDEYIEFEYSLGQVFFKGSPCMDAIVDRHLFVSLEKTTKDNPFIHGIVLFAGDLKESDYEDQQDLRKNWDKIINSEQKKKEEERVRKSESKTKRKEKVKVRNDHLNELETEYEFVELTEKRDESKRFSIKQILMSPLGVLLLWLGFGSFVVVARGIFLKIDHRSKTIKPVQREEKKQYNPKQYIEKSQPQVQHKQSKDKQGKQKKQ